MALKQLILKRKINERSTKLTELLEQRSTLEKRETDLEAALKEAEKPEDVEEVEKSADELTTEIEELDAEIKDLEAEKADLEAELAKIEDDGPQKNDEEERSKRSMKRKTVKTNEGAEGIEALRSGINDFVHSKGEKRAESLGFTTVEGGALIPEELLSPEMVPEDVIDLKKYVKVTPVNSLTGKFPVIKKSGTKMHTVAELEENPKLANPTFSPITFEIATRRGYIPISQEVIDDADYDITGLIRDEIATQSLDTVNADIAAILKTAPAKTVTGVDGLKDLLNKEIKKVYSNVKFIVSASLYAELDKLKDKNGRYLLQESITAASGKVLLGKEVVVLDDDVIGTKVGDMVGFVGEAASFARFFDRLQTSVEWVDNNIYGKLLAAVIRYDVKKTDSEAGFYITYTAAPAEG
ncbi:phage major capsid protein [Enterococcus sp. HY326]|uniref:phage major capsid protein n=1 Tax=Enterococcus sp. HY326 TaxID=2971265 RepID=UPI002240051E|nr:phage major capsid protein [Enterococcus sp. HY326]